MKPLFIEPTVAESFPEADVRFKDLLSAVVPDGAMVGEAKRVGQSLVVPKLADYVAAPDLARFLAPGVENLSRFAKRIQHHALRGLIVNFDKRVHSLDEITAAFHQRPRNDNMLEGEDPILSIYFPL